MLWVAMGGILLNGGIMLGLWRSGGPIGKSDINIRGAFLHMLGDLIGVAGIMLGALVIRATGWTRVDPVLSILISVLIVWTAWNITRESLNILLEGLPKGLELKQVVSAIKAIDGVLDVHDLHIWSLGSNSHALSCHVLIADMPPSQSDRIYSIRIKNVPWGIASIVHSHYRAVRAHEVAAISILVQAA